MSKLEKLAPGAVFAGDFRVVRLLGEGGMGVVYVAEQLSTGKRRALKVMQPELVANEGLRARFEKEARVGAHIRSDHVVEVIAAGVDAASGTPWLAMELLEGEDLAARTGKGPVPRAEARAIAAQLRHALGEAHRGGIVHRDLKPENIFLAAPRRAGVPFMVKVLDFGIARVTAEARTTSSATNVVLGTPLWMAPEQALPGTPVTPAADVWALGLIVYKMLTGRYFWRTVYAESPSVMMLMNEAFMLPMASASERAAADGCGELLPEGFDAWFERCAARAPEDRFPEAGAALDALDRVLAGPEAASGAGAVTSGVGGAAGAQVGDSARVAGDAQAASGVGAVTSGVGGAAGAQVGDSAQALFSARTAAPPDEAIEAAAVSARAPESETFTAAAASAIEAAAAAAAAAATSAIQTANAAGGATTVSATTTVSMTEGGGEAGSGPPAGARTGAAQGRSRASRVISVMVSVTVAFAAVGLAARSFLNGGGASNDPVYGATDYGNGSGPATAGPRPAHGPVPITTVELPLVGNATASVTATASASSSALATASASASSSSLPVSPPSTKLTATAPVKGVPQRRQVKAH